MRVEIRIRIGAKIGRERIIPGYTVDKQHDALNKSKSAKSTLSYERFS